jgi:prepilin-type processing-associated H-X9-DG protein
MRILPINRSAELRFGRCLWPRISPLLRLSRHEALANDHLPIGRSAFRWGRGPLSPRESLPQRKNSRIPPLAGLSALRSRAFTLNDTIAIIAVLLVVGVVLLPALSRPRRDKAGHQRIRCISNLRQVALGFLIWALDNNERFPMQVSTNQGGSREWIGGPNTWRHFEVMSNEINTPKLLFCPAERDALRTMASYFGPPTGALALVPFTNNLNLSYFVGVDAVTNANVFLAGDRGLTNGLPVIGGLLDLNTNQPAGWAVPFHVDQGNVAMADGSVQSLRSHSLREVVRASGAATNRLALP